MSRDFVSSSHPVDVGVDYRARMLRERAEAQERREHALIEQRSEANTPEARILIWERLHEIDLPANPAHRLVQVIARQTGLTVDLVREAQQERRRPRVVEPPALPPVAT